MFLKDLLQRKITNIYCLNVYEVGGMDTSECFIELNNEIIIDIPFSGNDTVWVKQLDPKAKNLFENLYDIPTYLINKEGKSIVQIKESQKKRRNKPFYRL